MVDERRGTLEWSDPNDEDKERGQLWLGTAERVGSPLSAFAVGRADGRAEASELRSRLEEAEEHIRLLEYANGNHGFHMNNLFDTMECVKTERNRLREENFRLKSLTSLRVASGAPDGVE